jgi:circadian clock protein KaiC
MRRLLRDDAVVADFLYSLGASLALLGATTVVVIEGDPEDSVHYAEITVCDIIVALHWELHTGVQRRRLEVVKARGSSPLEGKHPYTITSAGISLFPRFESLVTDTATSGWTADRLPFGLEGIDALLGGGLTAGTTTLVAGSPGMGKTLLGIQFVVEGARTGEPALFLGFMESAEQLREQARTFGLDLASVEAAGQARLLTMPGYDQEVDAIASLVMEDIEQRGTKRLVIDSASQLERSIGDFERNAGFLSALVGYLRQHGVTTYITLDIPTIAGPALEFAATPLSVIAENLLLMRNVEYRGELHRVFSVLKMRFSNHDRAIYEYGITPGEGIRISGPAPLGEGLLTGMARPLLDIPMQREIDAG